MKAMRITDITKELKLNHPESRRHISRLRDSGLIVRDDDGNFHLTPFGETVLQLIQEYNFLSNYREYFQTHLLSNIPTRFVKQIGELSESKKIENAMDFLRQTETLFKESKDYVLLLVNQFPLNSLSTINQAIERGVQFRIIEPRDRIFSPDIDSITSEETTALSRTRHTPLVEQKMVDKVNSLLYLSEKRCVLAFPTSEGQYDYLGFTATDAASLTWCKTLFEYYWNESEQRTSAASNVHARREPILESRSLGQIVIIGTENPEVDAQIVQDAVDNYDVVILKGTFNFGTSKVQISRSVIIRGEGRENDIPSTVIYKKGWKFPSTEFDSVFMVDGEGAEVTIENMQFTDFNYICIWGVHCDCLNIKNNRITLMTGYGRGVAYGAFGDTVIGIWIRGSETRSFRGNISIEGNYIDFARGGAFGGFLSRGGLEENSEYRPDLFNHEYFMGIGVGINQASGPISIDNNIIRNANARGIATVSCLPSADVRIRRNTIESDVYGSYPFSSPEAGAGILAQSAFGYPSPGFNVEIEENTIKLNKLNYSGIKVLGPVMDREGVNKLKDGIIRNNHIQLKKGYEGIHVRKCDDFEVTDNKISGEAYYGVRISGSRRYGKLDLSALNNRVEDNDMGDLRIRDPDKYSNNHVDGRMFMGTKGKSATAHVWLNTNTKGNIIKVKVDEDVVDEGEGNTIFFQR